MTLRTIEVDEKFLKHIFSDLKDKNLFQNEIDKILKISAKIYTEDPKLISLRGKKDAEIIELYKCDSKKNMWRGVVLLELAEFNYELTI